jgi:hypothetical protein
MEDLRDEIQQIDPAIKGSCYVSATTAGTHNGRSVDAVSPIRSALTQESGAPTGHAIAADRGKADAP